METGTAVLIGVGVIAVVGIGGLLVANASRPATVVTQGSPMTGQPALQGDAAMLFAGLSGGSQVLSSIFSGIANINRSNQNSRDGGAKPPLAGNPGGNPVYSAPVPSANPFDYLSRAATT